LERISYISGTAINTNNGSFHHLVKPHGKTTPVVMVISALQSTL